MPPEVLTKFGIKKIRLVNQACKAIYLEEAKQVFRGFEVKCDQEIKLSAAYGAAMAALKMAGTKE